MATTTHLRRVCRVGLIALIAVASHGTALFADEVGTVRLLVGRSAVVNTDSPIARISLTSSDIADAMVTQPNQLLIQGKVAGTISMFVWDRAGVMTRYDVIVERDLSKLTAQIRELFPGESITVEGNGKSIVVAGKVASKYVADKAVEVATGYVEKKDDVVSLMQVREPGPPPQVLLRVRFAEVSRNALTELGGSLFTGPDGYRNFLGRTGTQQFAGPTFDSQGTDSKLVFSDFLNLFFFDMKNQLGAVIKALQTRGLFQSLAEPNLVAESGKEASFLAGGEFPIPVAQGSGGGGVAISVVFKEFGIRLNFTPTVTSTGRVRLKVRPEVSTLDFANAIVLEGFRIPALSTRRTETEIELRDGQTFAIAGLLNNTATQSMQKIPGIGDIPILGLLFRSKAAQKNQTELVVMITPTILPQDSPGVTSEVPRLMEPYLAPPPQNKTFPTQAPAFTTPRPGGDDAAAAAQPKGAEVKTIVAPTPASAQPTPGEAAAVLTPARRPSGPMLMTTPPSATARPSSSTNTGEITPTPAPPAAEPTVTDIAATPPSSAAGATAPAVSGTSDSDTRPLTRDEKKATERALSDARKAQQQRTRVVQEQAKRDAEQAEVQKRKDEQEQKRQQQVAREQGKRDGAAAEKAAREAAQQAEVDKKHQKAIDEAAARLKLAEAAYQAELAKKGKS